MAATAGVAVGAAACVTVGVTCGVAVADGVIVAVPSAAVGDAASVPVIAVASVCGEDAVPLGTDPVTEPPRCVMTMAASMMMTTSTEAKIRRMRGDNDRNNDIAHYDPFIAKWRCSEAPSRVLA